MALYPRASMLNPGLLKGCRIAAAIIALATVAVFVTLGYNVDPSWYWLSAGAVIPAGILIVLRRVHRLAVARVNAKRRWGASGVELQRVRHSDLERLRAHYFEGTDAGAVGWVDDKTWSDLGMADLLDDVDICFTTAGRNELRRALRDSLPTPGRRELLVSAISRMRSDPGHREHSGRVLASIGEEADADPAQLLWNAALDRDRLYPMFVALCVLSLLSLALSVFANPAIGLAFVFVMFVINMWVYFRKARYLSVHIPTLRVLSRMIIAAREVAELKEARARVSAGKGAFRMLLTGAPSPTPSMSGDLGELLLMYFKIFFQADLIAFGRVVGHIRRDLAAYREIYRHLGSLDAAFALASYADRMDMVCGADLVPNDSGSRSRTLELVDVYHPAVPDVVANTVTLTMPGAVVTGTNMAGKSTFLRTLGINVLFAQGAGFAFASRYRAPGVRVLSSIDKHDDLSEGRSFYFNEAQRIYEMIENVDSEAPTLLLIDELLAGTNSLERESASLAILHYLADHHALTIAATHDVAIARGVEHLYSTCHFTDSADRNGLAFDYKLRDGIVTTRNAIKLLRLIGYPEGVIAEALERTGQPEPPA